MKFEILKKSHLKRNIVIGIATISILTAGILTFTKAKYRTTQNIPLVNGTINYELSDLNLIGVYIQGDDGYTKSDTIPEEGYVLNSEESYCTVNGEEDTNMSINYNADTKSLSVSPMTSKGTKCYLYFDEKGITNIEELIASKNLATRTDFSTIVTEDTAGTIYYEDTSKGRTYYFAGAPTDNWIKFGGFYWRIIRINEDGTLRLIYSGNDTSGPVTTGENTQIGTSAFNSLFYNNMYVGYMYTDGNVHGLDTNSEIKGVLDEWYQNNLTSYNDKIDGNAGFCGDRTPYQCSDIKCNDASVGGGTGSSETYYGAFIRLYRSEKSPSLECPNNSDLYTTSGSEQGNKALTYPIGLISADEVAYAGGVSGSINDSFYLFTNLYYWTMSPFYVTGSFANSNVFSVYSTGQFAMNWVPNTDGVRPVINLKADIQITGGTGTSTNPYIVN